MSSTSSSASNAQKQISIAVLSQQFDAQTGKVTKTAQIKSLSTATTIINKSRDLLTKNTADNFVETAKISGLASKLASTSATDALKDTGALIDDINTIHQTQVITNRFESIITKGQEPTLILDPIQQTNSQVVQAKKILLEKLTDEIGRMNQQLGLMNFESEEAPEKCVELLSKLDQMNRIVEALNAGDSEAISGKVQQYNDAVNGKFHDVITTKYRALDVSNKSKFCNNFKAAADKYVPFSTEARTRQERVDDIKDLNNKIVGAKELYELIKSVEEQKTNIGPNPANTALDVAIVKYNVALESALHDLTVIGTNENEHANKTKKTNIKQSQAHAANARNAFNLVKELRQKEVPEKNIIDNLQGSVDLFNGEDTTGRMALRALTTKDLNTSRLFKIRDTAQGIAEKEKTEAEITVEKEFFNLNLMLLERRTNNIEKSNIFAPPLQESIQTNLKPFFGGAQKAITNAFNRLNKAKNIYEFKETMQISEQAGKIGTLSAADVFKDTVGVIATIKSMRLQQKIVNTYAESVTKPGASGKNASATATTIISKTNENVNTANIKLLNKLKTETETLKGQLAKKDIVHDLQDIGKIKTKLEQIKSVQKAILEGNDDAGVQKASNSLNTELTLIYDALA